MIIYKYVTSKGDDLIRNLRIKVNRLSNFNDPFELLPAVKEISPEQVIETVFNNSNYLHYLYDADNLDIRPSEKTFEQLVDEMQDPVRRNAMAKAISEKTPPALRLTAQKSRIDVDKLALIACFCGEAADPFHEILMWAHYAERHKGLRIAIDSNALHSLPAPILKMEYSEKRPCLNPTDYWNKGARALKDFYSKVLVTKGSAWAYENEQRWLVHLKKCIKDGEDYYVPIEKKSILAVDCGVYCSEKFVSLIKDLARQKLTDSVKVRKAEIDNSEFKLNYLECIN